MRRKHLTRKQAQFAGQIELLPTEPPPPASYHDLVLSARKRGAFGMAPQLFYNTVAELFDRQGIVMPLHIPAPEERGWVVWDHWRTFCRAQQREYQARVAEAGPKRGLYMPFPELPGAQCNEAGLRRWEYRQEHGHYPPPPQTIICQHTGKPCSRDRNHIAGVVHLARYLAEDLFAQTSFIPREPVARHKVEACCVFGLSAIARRYVREMSDEVAYWKAEIKVSEALLEECDALLAHDPCWLNS